MNLVEIVKQKDELLARNSKILCNRCTEWWFSPFDRLFLLANNGICWDCSPDNKETGLLEEYIMSLLL